MAALGRAAGGNGIAVVPDAAEAAVAPADAPGGAAVGLIVCEVWYQMLNGGWETLIPMVLYSLCLMLMIGTVIGWLIHEETRSWTKKSDR